MHGEEYHFRSDPRRRDNAPSCIVILCRADHGELIGERRDRATKKMRKDAREISLKSKKGCLALNCTFTWRKHNLTA